MMTASEARSGKSGRDENFPVASLLVEARMRPVILAFYRFVRAADDVADHPRLESDRKLALLDGLADALEGRGIDPEAEPLRVALAAHGLPPTHALEMLEAFRLDVRKRRYENWAELMDYCRFSAAPVGRFVLDAHGEDRALWPLSDALCAALQVINHLQDCGKDYRNLDRVYLPRDALEARSASVKMLDASRAPPPLRAALVDLAGRAGELLDRGDGLASRIANRRLALEVSVISSLARTQVRRLRSRDPLSEPVRLGKAEASWRSVLAVARALAPAQFGLRHGRAEI